METETTRVRVFLWKVDQGYYSGEVETMSEINPTKPVKEGLIEIRKEVVLFAVDMEKILKKHDPEKGNSWKTKDYWTLIDMLEKQHADFVWLSSHKKFDEAKEKLLDIANVCMMLYQFYLKRGLGDSVHTAGLPGLKDQDRNEPDPYLDVHGGLD